MQFTGIRMKRWMKPNNFPKFIFFKNPSNSDFMCKTTLKYYLVKAKKKGENADKEFRKKFSELYYDKIFAIARSFTNSIYDAEEVTQDLFVKKFLKFPHSTFERGLFGNFDGWLLVIIRNYCFSYLNSSSRNQCNDLETIFDLGYPPCVLEKYDFIALLKTLPPDLREIFTLQLEGYKLKEVAKILNMTVAQVKMKILRFRKITYKVLS